MIFRHAQRYVALAGARPWCALKKWSPVGGIVLLSSCAAAPDPVVDHCGEDIIELMVRRDPRTLDLSDQEVSERWFSRNECLAAAGDAQAALNIGVAFRDGSDGSPQDLAKAAHWFRMAALLGDGMAQYNMGRLYETGSGVSPDAVEAYVWYMLALSSLDPKDGMTRAWASNHLANLGRRLDARLVAEAERRAAIRKDLIGSRVQP